jgi:aminoglycoside N3'-acetyltransferase
VENHHRVPTIDPEKSPLGMFFNENGYVLTISSADSVTFMHLVEELSGAKCCSKRGEEYHTILPDGRKVKTRAWGWRATTCPECPANRTEEIFAYIRKYGDLREVKLNNASLKLFSMEDYFRAYRTLMKKFCRNRAVPRQVDCTVASDWNEKTRQLKKSDAYTGDWMPDK